MQVLHLARCYFTAAGYARALEPYTHPSGRIMHVDEVEVAAASDQS